ncbi:MAG: HupE/UreJ family protein [Lentisphaerae bacterium]|nr:HupE/UreJ family protein [Lentisphaerota bacterium]
MIVCRGLRFQWRSFLFRNRYLASSLAVLLLLVVTQTAEAHGISAADRAAMLSGGYARYIGLGASHMLTGYDHLLFLLGVMFFLTRFRDIAKFITAFTLGHCITLIGATFMKVSINYFMIDALIAYSGTYRPPNPELYRPPKPA